MNTLDHDAIDWNKGGGLLPVVVQHAVTLQVLMQAYMNPEALAQTEKTGSVTFYSRTKKRLWQKGETSGHTLSVESMHLDCDADALLIRARPAGPTCHRGTSSCFVHETAPGVGWLAHLESIIASRKGADPASSYTAHLFSEGVERMAKKVGEEGVEVAISAATGDGRLSEEAADLLYHLLVLLHASGAGLSDAIHVLRRRHRSD